MIAFLGLGSMGGPMAENVLRRGHALTVWNRSSQRAAVFSGRAKIVGTSVEAARDAEIVILMLADPPAVRSVIDAIAPALKRDAIVVDMSTIDPQTARKCAEKIRVAGGDYIDAPVSGTVGPAKAGKLVIFAGGHADQIERVRPVLESMGQLRRVGETGQGMAMKLVLNGLGAHMLTGFTAMLALGRKQGLDLRTMIEGIQAGAFSSPLFSSKGDRIERRDFAPDFTLALMLKDQNLVLDTASRLNYPMPTESAIRTVLEEAVALGLGADDLAGLSRLFERWAGLS